ncbi:MAG: PmeII family type II restriction endonuclease [Candidatus Brocadiia bacterium]
MPGNPDIPKAVLRVLSKASALETLRAIDADQALRQRVLDMETRFRERISTHVDGLPERSAPLSRFNTSPFVLMIYASQRHYSLISEIERDILPAKLFSSMETSAGRMVQTVVLPFYGWEDVLSSMHSVRSVIDGRRRDGKILRLATIKSGPRCLNDEMSKDIADDIVAHAEQWAQEDGVDHIEFSYGVLYGTEKTSNKKDWHVLRNIVEAKGTRFMLELPRLRWNCSFQHRGARVDVTVRIGTDWWQHLGGPTALIEVLVALIRASVIPSEPEPANYPYQVSDLGSIVCLDGIPVGYNVSLLQRGQLQWLFFLLSHYCDRLTD